MEVNYSKFGLLNLKAQAEALAKENEEKTLNADTQKTENSPLKPEEKTATDFYKDLDENDIKNENKKNAAFFTSKATALVETGAVTHSVGDSSPNTVTSVDYIEGDFSQVNIKYLDPQDRKALEANKALIQQLQQAIIEAARQEQIDKETSRDALEEAKATRAEYERLLSTEGLSDEDKANLKAGIADIDSMIQNNLNGLMSFVSRIPSLQKQLSTAINSQGVIIKTANDKMNTLAQSVDKALKIDYTQRIMDLKGIKINDENEVNLGSGRADFYNSNDEKKVENVKNISDKLRTDVADGEATIDQDNGNLKNNQTNISSILQNLENMDDDAKSEALKNLGVFAGKIAELDTTLQTNISSCTENKLNFKVAVDNVNNVVKTANANIAFIQNLVTEAQKVQFNGIETYASGINIADKKSVDNSGEREKYYTNKDKNAVKGGETSINAAIEKADAAKKLFNTNNASLLKQQDKLGDLLVALRTSTGNAKEKTLNSIKALTKEITTSGNVVNENINTFKSAKKEQSTAVNSYNSAVVSANSNINNGVQKAKTEAEKAKTISPSGDDGQDNGGSAGVIEEPPVGDKLAEADRKTEEATKLAAKNAAYDLYNAMKGGATGFLFGLGTDEATVKSVLEKYKGNADMIERIKQEYRDIPQNKNHISLESDIRSDFSGKEEKDVLALLQ